MIIKTMLALSLIATCFTTLGVSSIAKADAEQSAGGWGLNCNSGNVSCTSGRTIGCQSTVADNSFRSLCTQHTGSVGWVYCAVYDQSGNTISQFSDQCP